MSQRHLGLRQQLNRRPWNWLLNQSPAHARFHRGVERRAGSSPQKGETQRLEGSHGAPALPRSKVKVSFEGRSAWKAREGEPTRHGPTGLPGAGPSLLQPCDANCNSSTKQTCQTKRKKPPCPMLPYLAFIPEHGTNLGNHARQTARSTTSSLSALPCA